MILPERLSPSQLANFNAVRRDAWVASVAKRLPAGTEILDVGAGECKYRPLFTHCVYKTQDFSQYHGTPYGITRMDWEYGQIDYVSDITAIPVPDSSFDAVLCTEVFEHVPEPIAAIREIGRILRPGGSAFISAPLGSGLHQQPYHFYGGFTPFFYERFLAEADMRVVSVEANGHFFRQLLQEANRGANIVRLRYRFWHPAAWLARLVQTGTFARWMTAMDDKFEVDEFTVGYFVEAQKNG